MTGWTYTLDRLSTVLGGAWSGGRAPDGGPLRDRGLFSGVSTDTRTLRAGEVFFALTGERFDGSQFVAEAFAKGAAAAVTTRPNNGGPCLVVSDPLAALQAFAAYHRAQHALPLLGITGSCGKTSTKDLTAALLATRFPVVKTQGNLNNAIGCPLSLLQIDGGTAMAVIEMGANHQGEIAGLCAIARPTEAAITLIAPAHLEGFGSIENVALAKSEIVEALPGNGTFYVNADDPRCVDIAERFKGDTVCFGEKGDVVIESIRLEQPDEMRLRIRPVGELRLPLSCRAHAMNVALAVAVGLRHGVREFEGPLRQACLSSARFRRFTVGPLEVIDDTYNANPASMSAALEALTLQCGADGQTRGGCIAALGDMLELGSAASALHRALGECAARLGVTRLFVLGQYAGDVVDGAKASGLAEAEVLNSHEAIAHAVHAVAVPGDRVLFKGSRGMKMERAMAILRTLYEGT